MCSEGPDPRQYDVLLPRVFCLLSHSDRWNTPREADQPGAYTVYCADSTVLFCIPGFTAMALTVIASYKKI